MKTPCYYETSCSSGYPTPAPLSWKLTGQRESSLSFFRHGHELRIVDFRIYEKNAMKPAEYTSHHQTKGGLLTLSLFA